MKRKYILSLLTVAMLLPFTAVKAQYDTGDSTVCYNLMTNNFAVSNLLNWNDPDPGNWIGIVWNTATPKRITHLNLHGDGVSSTTATSTHSGSDGTNFLRTYPGFIDPGVDSKLVGAIDLTALTELFAFDFRRHDSIASINVTGLNNLEYARIAQDKEILTALDFSNLPNLQHLDIGTMNALMTIDASNCPRLKVLKSKDDNALNSVNITGSDSLEYIIFNLNNPNDVFDLDLTGKTQLTHLKVKRSGVKKLNGINTCSSLIVCKAARNDSLVGTFDFADYDFANMIKFSVGRTLVDAVNNWTVLSGNTSLEVVNVEESGLTLSNAAQIANEVIVNGNGNNSVSGDNQVRYGGDTIYTGGATSYPGEALIDINGTNVASAFTLFDGAGAQVGATNATGIFTFPLITDTGIYYVEMTNPGAAPASNSVLLTTNNFAVRCQGGSGSQTLTICDGDSVVVGTSVYKTTGTFVEPFLMVSGCDSLFTTNLTVFAPIDTSVAISNVTMTSNETGAAYQWIDCDNGNSNIAGATNATYVATANGNYAVVVTVGSCSSTSACINISTVGINEFDAANTVSIYPNPMNELVTIELAKAVKNTQVIIVNVEGKVVYNNIVNTAKITVNGADWNNGIYIVKITNEEYTKTIKLIK